MEKCLWAYRYIEVEYWPLLLYPVLLLIVPSRKAKRTPEIVSDGTFSHVPAICLLEISHLKFGVSYVAPEFGLGQVTGHHENGKGFLQYTCSSRYPGEH